MTLCSDCQHFGPAFRGEFYWPYADAQLAPRTLVIPFHAPNPATEPQARRPHHWIQPNVPQVTRHLRSCQKYMLISTF